MSSSTDIDFILKLLRNEAPYLAKIIIKKWERTLTERYPERDKDLQHAFDDGYNMAVDSFQELLQTLSKEDIQEAVTELSRKEKKAP